MLLTGTLFPLFLVPSALASCAASVSPPGSIPCCPLCSTGFHRLPHYYGTVRLLPYRQVLSVYKTSIPLTGLRRSVADLPGMQLLLHALATLLDPDGTCITSQLRSSIAACDQRNGIGFRFILLTGLYRFTLSHCGSCAPLPTLKPRLAASAPRLSTGCSLRFARFGLSPNYIICTELAHPFRLNYTILTGYLPPKNLAGQYISNTIIRRRYRSVTACKMGIIWQETLAAPGSSSQLTAGSS